MPFRMFLLGLFVFTDFIVITCIGLCVYCVPIS